MAGKDHEGSAGDAGNGYFSHSGHWVHKCVHFLKIS